ncbi:hypothetical protein LVB87_08815 [Lysobacter sp. KIS68-7]|uniref:hypothetical protein n=1 Tax=Lysobacter sp. KIS68-7 TaxID=2904252 RepID=UPI001E5A3712|nr:hypothetical protein [Lysobacter sp. KIS68-7]UHQ18327.1 hypothetical protein LVB87_08815 [Lysobacter sp. KIS68-7]
MRNPAALSVIALLTGCATCAGGLSGVEERNLRGGGFCDATLQVSGDFGFEGVGHFRHCFYKARDFGQCDGMSVAPSGSIALWQDVSTGSVVAFRPGWHQPQVLLSFPTPSSLQSANWNEPAGTVTLKAWNHADEHQLAIPGNG